MGINSKPLISLILFIYLLYQWFTGFYYVNRLLITVNKVMYRN